MGPAIRFESYGYTNRIFVGRGGYGVEDEQGEGDGRGVAGGMGGPGGRWPDRIPDFGMTGRGDRAGGPGGFGALAVVGDGLAAAGSVGGGLNVGDAGLG